MNWFLRLVNPLWEPKPSTEAAAPAEVLADKTRAILREVYFDLKYHTLARAISRLESQMIRHYAEPVLRRRLAHLYLDAGQPAKAGKYLYLVDNLGPIEQAAVAAFEKSVGCCPLNISRKLTPQQHFSYHQLDAYARQRYANLIGRIEARFGRVPRFLTAFKFQLDKYGPQPDDRCH